MFWRERGAFGTGVGLGVALGNELLDGSVDGLLNPYEDFPRMPLVEIPGMPNPANADTMCRDELEPDDPSKQLYLDFKHLYMEIKISAKELGRAGALKAFAEYENKRQAFKLSELNRTDQLEFWLLKGEVATHGLAPCLIMDLDSCLREDDGG